MRYAVIFKTYMWDPFVERQAARYAAATQAGDFYISVDETNAQFLGIAFEHISRTSNTKLVASGLANRFEKGSLIWWNADYPHHQFYREHPEYDYYVFVEYDSLVQRSLDDLVAEIAATGADFVAQPMRQSMENWFWTPPHLAVYGQDELRATLNCVSIYSNRAMALLLSRRLDMERDGVHYWPNSEAFIATEIHRAGYSFRPLSMFGETSAYDWYPPTLEDDLLKLPDRVFLHPVLDQARYIGVNLRSNPTLASFVNRNSPLRRSLARLPVGAYLHLMPGAIARRMWTSVRDRSRRLYQPALSRRPSR